MFLDTDYQDYFKMLAFSYDNNINMLIQDVYSRLYNVPNIDDNFLKNLVN